MFRRFDNRRETMGASAAAAIDTSTIANLAVLYRSNNEYATGAWEDMASAESADEATNPPTYSASDAIFGGRPSLAFDGTNDVLLDTRAASSFNFITQNSGVEWMAWVVFSLPSVAAGNSYPISIGWPTVAAHTSFAIQRNAATITAATWANSSGSCARAIGGLSINTPYYLIYGTKSSTGVNGSYGRSKGTGSAYASVTATRGVVSACDSSLSFGKNQAAGTFSAITVLEFGVAQTALTQAIADGVAQYFVNSYGVAP